MAAASEPTQAADRDAARQSRHVPRQSASGPLADRLAVMSMGRVEQVGTPRELYRRPANRFVAEFIGEANVIEGELLSSADGVVIENNKIENWPTCCSACWRKPATKLSMPTWPFRRPTSACPIRAAILAATGSRSSAATRA